MNGHIYVDLFYRIVKQMPWHLRCSRPFYSIALNPNYYIYIFLLHHFFIVTICNIEGNLPFDFAFKWAIMRQLKIYSRCKLIKSGKSLQMNRYAICTSSNNGA